MAILVVTQMGHGPQSRATGVLLPHPYSQKMEPAPVIILGVAEGAPQTWQLHAHIPRAITAYEMGLKPASLQPICREPVLVWRALESLVCA